jgi:hypothetical protein
MGGHSDCGINKISVHTPPGPNCAGMGLGVWVRLIMMCKVGVIISSGCDT